MSLVASACDDGPSSYGDPLDDPQLPARGHDDVAAWLEAGYYTSWKCEEASHPARPDSGHAANRICTNEILAADTGTTGPYPVGSAAVKEIFNGDGSLRYHAVYRKVEAADGGDSWYWYEGKGDNIVANGMGDDTCTGCHSDAQRDFVFVLIRQ